MGSKKTRIQDKRKYYPHVFLLIVNCLDGECEAQLLLWLLLVLMIFQLLKVARRLLQIGPAILAWVLLA